MNKEHVVRRKHSPHEERHQEQHQRRLYHQLASCAVSDNNRGASLIESGVFDEAILSFKQALKITKDLAHLERAINASTAGQQEQATSGTDFEQPPQPLTPAQQRGSADHQAAISMSRVLSSSSLPSTPPDADTTSILVEADDTEDEYTVYRRAIRIAIPIAAAPTRTDSPTISSVISVYVIFNLALAHHLLVLDNEAAFSSTSTIHSDGSGSNCSRQKDSANNKIPQGQNRCLKLYECVLNLLQQDIFENQFCSIPDVFLVMAATLNNLGQVHQSLQNKNLANSCFQRLLSILVLLKDQESSQSSGNGQEWECFFHNVLFFIFPQDHCRSAAAA